MQENFADFLCIFLINVSRGTLASKRMFHVEHSAADQLIVSRETKRHRRQVGVFFCAVIVAFCLFLSNVLGIPWKFLPLCLRIL